MQEYNNNKFKKFVREINL